jgi:hypothetical protein
VSNKTVSSRAANGIVSHTTVIEKASTNVGIRGIKYAIALDNGKPLFDVISTSTSPQESAIICNDLKIPFLDDLLIKLKQNLKVNENLPIPPDGIDRLYQPNFTIVKNNELLYEVSLVHPEMVYIASDKYLEEKPMATYRNLTFNKIGFPGTLAVLPTKFSYKLSWDADSLNGKLLIYDPDKQGTYGEEINIEGNYVSVVNRTQARSTAVATAHSSFLASQKSTKQSPASPRALFEAHATPSPAALSIATSKTGPAELKFQTLWSLDFKSAELQAASQDLIYKCMLYHINEDDRNFFFHETKPTGLNPMLGENLSAELKTWVVNTYAPAYICNTIMLEDDVTKNSWHRPFTKDEEKKIVYFWEGKVSNARMCNSDTDTSPGENVFGEKQRI